MFTILTTTTRIITTTTITDPTIHTVTGIVPTIAAIGTAHITAMATTADTTEAIGADTIMDTGTDITTDTIQAITDITTTILTGDVILATHGKLSAQAETIAHAQATLDELLTGQEPQTFHVQELPTTEPAT